MTPVTKKPNPQNEKNQFTLEELEAEIKRYAQLICAMSHILTFAASKKKKQHGRAWPPPRKRQPPDRQYKRHRSVGPTSTPHSLTPHKHPYSKPSVKRPSKTRHIPSRLPRSHLLRHLLLQRQPPCKHTSTNSAFPSNRTLTSSPTAYTKSSSTATRLTASPIASSALQQNDSTSGIAISKNEQVQTALGLAIYCAASRVCSASRNEHLCFFSCCFKRALRGFV